MAMRRPARLRRGPGTRRAVGEPRVRVLDPCVLLLTLLCIAPGGAAEPRAWLAEMNRAFAELDYDGVFSYYAGGDVATLRVVHMVIDGENRERLAHLTDTRREVIRRGESAVSILARDDELVALAGSIPSGPFARAYSGAFDRVSDRYDVSHSGRGRVAGRAADRISVTPRDRDRYGYRIWLDRENRLMLRSELVGTNGETLENFQFSSISFGADVSPSSLEPTLGADLHTQHLEFEGGEDASSAAPRLTWRAAWVPVGFTVAAAEIHRTPAQPWPVDTVLYTDGLASFTIFVEDKPRAVEAGGVARHGATVAVSDQVRGPGGRWSLVTLVGEVPEATARRVAASVTYGAEF